jgi:hypothetical protein
VNLKEKIEKIESLLNAITAQNKITAEFLVHNDILKASKSMIITHELINDFNKVMFL